MKASLDCMFCMLDKADKMYSEYEPDKNKRMTFMKAVMKIISETGEAESSPATTAKIQRELSRYAGVSDHFKEEKRLSNQIALKIENAVWDQISASDDGIRQAIKYALAGNIIDLGVYDKIDEQEILAMIKKAAAFKIDEAAFERFSRDLGAAKNLVYLTDNAGEIVFDKLVIKQIQMKYPGLNIQVIVRGLPILNDATMMDANDVGLTEIVSIYENGTDIPGTDLRYVNEKTKDMMNNADLIISKGMGNFESLYGEALNIYFAFLCKCEYFTERFNVKLNESIFLHRDTIFEMDISH